MLDRNEGVKFLPKVMNTLKNQRVDHVSWRPSTGPNAFPPRSRPYSPAPIAPPYKDRIPLVSALKGIC